MHVVNTLAPVFLIIALGATLRRFAFLSDEFIRGLNRLAYWVALPTLLFVKIAQAPALGPSAWRMAGIVLTATAGMAAVAWTAGRLLGLRGVRLGSLVQVAFRGNLAFIGLPVIFFAFSNSPDPDAGLRAQSLTLVALGPVIVGYNVLAVTALLAGRHKFGRAALKRILMGVVTNPILLACLAGSGWSAWGATLPSFLSRALGSVGACALPIALISVGGCLAATRVQGTVTPAIVALLIKCGVGPLLGAGLALWFGATPEQTSIAMILLATPTAAASYVLAGQLGGDTALSASAILLSTLASIVSLSVVVALM